jgi:hypothetical protein
MRSSGSEFSTINRSALRGAACLTLLVLITWMPDALAQVPASCAGPDAADSVGALEPDARLPPYPTRPTEVVGGLFVKQIRDIDAVSNSFIFRGAITARWCDPRVAFDPALEGREEKVFIGEAAAAEALRSWRAQGFPVNSVDAAQVTERVFRHRHDGTVTGEVNLAVRLATNFDLRRFPFDRQSLQLIIESFTWDASQVVFVADESATGFAADFEIPEWTIEDVRAHVKTVDVRRSSEPFSRFVLTIDIKRKAGFYLWKVLLPLLAIVALSWAVFWMTDERFGVRVRASATGILTVVAYQFVANESLPRVAYLTVMDKIMLVSFVLLAITVLESFLVSRHQADDPERALAIDRVSRWLFPVSYVVLLTLIAQTGAG